MMKTIMLTLLITLFSLCLLVGCTQEFDAPSTPPDAPGEIPNEQVSDDVTVGGAIVLPSEAPWAWQGVDQLSLSQDEFVLGEADDSMQVLLENEYVYNHYYIYNPAIGWSDGYINGNKENTYLENVDDFFIDITAEMAGNNVLAVFLCRGSVTLNDGSVVDYCPDRGVHQWQVEGFTVALLPELELLAENSLPGNYEVTVVARGDFSRGGILAIEKTQVYPSGTDTYSTNHRALERYTNESHAYLIIPEGFVSDKISFTVGGIAVEGRHTIRALWSNEELSVHSSTSQEVFIGANAPSSAPQGPGTQAQFDCSATDFNNDGRVNKLDADLFETHFLEEISVQPEASQFDVDKSGLVDFGDYSYVSQCITEYCSIVDFNNDGKVDEADNELFEPNFGIFVADNPKVAIYDVDNSGRVSTGDFSILSSCYVEE